MIVDALSKVKNLFKSRALAYARVFQKDNVDVEIVLKDLAKFCRAHETTFHEDQRKHAALEGRKEVWLRIESHLKLTADELFELHKVKDITKER